MDTIVRISCIFLSFYMSNGEPIRSTSQQHPTIVFSPSELLNDKVTNNTDSAKLALRYGFHRTSECENYEKAFLCIQKCVDKGFDIAYSDKYCFCTCYVNQQKAKYTPENHFTRTRWKLGTPKTTKPAWIQKLADDSQKMSFESIHVIKKPGIRPFSDSVLCAETNGTDTVDAQNITISNNTINISNSNTTNGTDSLTVSDTTNASNLNASSAVSATDGLISDATNVTDSQSASNATVTQNVSDATNATDNQNENGVTNASDSVNQSGDTIATISDVTNVTNAQNASNTET